MGIRVRINSAGVKALLNSAELQADLADRANRIAAAAGASEDFVAEASIGRDRAQAFITTASHEGRRAEAEERALTRSIDAGR